MKLEFIEGIRILIVAFLVYVPTVTISGFFTAWVAKKCGDDLPERMGFLTMDPFAHISLGWFGFMLLGEIYGKTLTLLRGIPAFGKFIFLDPPPHTTKSKVILELFARPLIHFMMLSGAFIVITLLAKSSFVYTASLESYIDIIKFFFGQNAQLCMIFTLFGITDAICYFWEISRFSIFEYLKVLILVYLICSYPLELLFQQVLLGYGYLLNLVL